MVHADLAALVLGHLGDDGEAQPRPGPAAGLGRPVEAVEDAVDVRVGDPGPWSRTMSAPSPQTTSTTAAVGAVLDGVVEEVVDGTSIRAADPEIQRGRRRGDEGHAPAAAVGGGRLDGGAHQLVEAQQLLGHLGHVAAGQLGHVGDQRGELVELGEDVADSTSRSSGASRSICRTTSRLVRRLVSGVRSSCDGVEDELALTLPRRVERGEQAVEGPAQAAEFVGPAGIEPMGHVGGAGQVLHRVGQRRGAEHRARHAEAESTAEAMPIRRMSHRATARRCSPSCDAGEGHRHLEPPPYGHDQRAGGGPVAVAVARADGETISRTEIPFTWVVKSSSPARRGFRRWPPSVD